MSGAMEWNVFGDTSSLYPVLQWGLHHTVLQFGKYLIRWLAAIVCIIEAYELKCLFAYRIVDELLGFLHAHGDVHTSVAVCLYLHPCETLDVALTESCEAWEQESFLQLWFLTLRLCQFYKLWLRKTLFFGWDCVNPLQIAIRILLNLVLTVGSMERSTEGWPVARER